MSTGQIPFEMDGVSLSNARQAQRLKWSMERDKEIYMAQDEEIARQKADLRSKIEPLLTMERARRDLLAKFPASSTSSTGKKTEKDSKVGLLFIFFCFFRGWQAPDPQM